MSNVILIIIAVLVLAFIWLIWLRRGLINILRDLQQKQIVLQHDLKKRRDTVPYLLESFRSEQEPNAAWREILEQRKTFHGPSSMQQEWEFEKTLLHFVRDTNLSNINFLEAKKDVIDLTTLIEREKQEMEQAATRYNERKKQFPYSLASAIFGLRAV